jgi:hypothetical protein
VGFLSFQFESPKGFSSEALCAEEESWPRSSWARS